MWACFVGQYIQVFRFLLSRAHVGVRLKTNPPDARHAGTRSLYARFRTQSNRQHTRFSTGQKNNGRGWRVKCEDVEKR